MINPKKRLKEIINNIVLHKALPYIERKLTQAIDKEFVHKDNLPSIDEITILICDGRCGEESLCLDCSIKTAKAIRKLIEGKK